MEYWYTNEKVLGLHYQRFLAVLDVYGDANWKTLSDDSKDDSWWSYILESEIIAPATTSEEPCWLRGMLTVISLQKADTRPLY